jgi:FAD/FMN-containing dehydrogenase
MRIGSADALVHEFAAEVGTTDAVAVVGLQSKWTVGGTLSEGTRLVSAPSGVLEYQPDEMTVRVRAGTSVAELEAAIGTGGQRTALASGEGTVGGALAVGQNDLCVLGRGQVRHALLQVTYVAADGAIVTGGAPTVKNVSGFDLPRLLVGSLGTLGLIAEVILRTNPVPVVSAWVMSSDAHPFSVRDRLHHPSAILWDGSATWLQLEGHPADVEDEFRVVRTLGAWETVAGPPDLPTCRWSLRPSDLRQLDSSQTGEFVASIGVGTVFAANPQPLLPLSPALCRVGERVKAEFDPRHRLNPGRDPMKVT